jgi:hypothetical protein
MSPWPPVLCALLLHISQLAHGEVPTITLHIKDHVFVPDIIDIPQNTKVKLLVVNEDSSPEEFESYELNREKVIDGKRRTMIFIGPLPPGEYPFFGEFNPKTAQGILRVKDDNKE